MSTEIALREYFEALLRESDLRHQQRFDAQTKAIDAALMAAEKAVTKAETANEKRFEGVNEFRGSLNDMVATLMPRAEAVQIFRSMDEKLDQVRQRIDKSEGAGGGLKAGWGYLVAAAAVAIAWFK